MAQGFKAKPPKKVSSSNNTRKKLQPKDPKKGARAIASKNPALKVHSDLKKKHTSSHTVEIEKHIAAQAGAHGKLTILKPLATDQKKK